MPRSRNRQGLTENASGQIVCPLPGCREHRLTLVWMVYRSPYESVTVHTEALRVIHQTETDQRAGIGQHLTVLWRCREGHEFTVEMDYRSEPDEPGLGGAAFGTAWDEEE